MENHKEVKIAIVLGAIMLTIFIVIMIIYNSNQKDALEADIRVFKHYNTTGDTKGEYYECKISSEDATHIYNEFKRAKLLTDKDKVPGQTITGTYKIVNGSEYLAFDDDSSFIFKGDTQTLYAFSSDVYNYVIKLCG